VAVVFVVFVTRGLRLRERQTRPPCYYSTIEVWEFAGSLLESSLHTFGIRKKKTLPE
jgi:hypothetical protein